MRWPTHFFAALFIMALTSCGNTDFEVGDPVWIDLSTETVLRRGHAEGHIISIREGLVEVQVSRLEMEYDHELVGVLARGTGFIPLEIVSPMEVGRARSEKLDQIVNSLTDAVRTRSFDGPAVALAKNLNKDLGNREIEAALEVMEVGTPLLKGDTAASLDGQLEAIADGLESLTKLAKEYPDVIATKFLPTEPIEKFHRTIGQMNDGHVPNDNLPIRAGFAVFDAALVEKIDSVEVMWRSAPLDATVDLYGDILGVVDRFLEFTEAVGGQHFLEESPDEIRQSIHKSLVDEYKRKILRDAGRIADADDNLVRELIKGTQADARSVAQVTGDITVEQKVADDIITFVRIRALKDYDLSTVYSLEEAEHLFEQAQDQWTWVSKMLDEAVLADKEKESLFLKPVRTNIAKREEEERRRQAEEKRRLERVGKWSEAVFIERGCTLNFASGNGVTYKAQYWNSRRREWIDAAPKERFSSDRVRFMPLVVEAPEPPYSIDCR